MTVSYLPDPRGAGLHQGSQLLYTCTFVRQLALPLVLSPPCAKESYTAIIPQTPNIYTDSDPPKH